MPLPSRQPQRSSGASECVIRPNARASSASINRRNASLAQAGARPSKLRAVARQRFSPWTLTTRGARTKPGAAPSASAAGCSESLTMKRAPRASRASRTTSRARPDGDARYVVRWRSVARASRWWRSSNSSAKPPGKSAAGVPRPARNACPAGDVVTTSIARPEPANSCRSRCARIRWPRPSATAR